MPIRNNSQRFVGGAGSVCISVKYTVRIIDHTRTEMIIKFPNDLPQTEVNTNRTIAVTGIA